MKHIAVPIGIASRVPPVVKSMAVRAEHIDIVKENIHYAKTAAIAVRPVVGQPAVD